MGDDLFPDPIRRAASFSYMLLKERDSAALRKRVVEDTRWLLSADAVRLLEYDAHGALTARRQTGVDLPTCAVQFEPVIAEATVIAGKSLISNHHRLYPELRSLAAECLNEGVLTHALLLRYDSDVLGVVAVHWIGRDRPEHEERLGFYYYWDSVRLAIAIDNERRFLEQLAYTDELTGLPNNRILKRELESRLEAGDGVTVLHVDFDGMREANNSFGYEEGGDVLIQHVARALGDAAPEDFLARTHRAGDEFALILRPGEDGATRAAALERTLDAIELPDAFRRIYRGASVGWATGASGDTPDTLLANAAARMRERKVARRPERRRGA